MSNDDLLQKLDDRKQWVLIGKGSFGEVYKAKWLGVDVAVKTSDEYVSENPILEEFIISSSIRHPNIVSFFVASPNYIVMELMDNGTLDDILAKQRFSVPPMEIRKRWCSQIAMAVYYLHESGIVHSDIKPENIMIDSNWRAKVCDVGGGYFIDDDPRDKIYTDMYLPLTLHLGEKGDLGKATDMYSLVSVMLCILSWEKDLYKLLGIQNFERMLSENSVTREEVIGKSLKTCLLRVYNMIKSYDISHEAKSFMFMMFSEPCKHHVDDPDVQRVIENNREACRSLDFIVLSEM